MSVQLNTYVLYGNILDYAELRARHRIEGGSLYDLVDPYLDNAFSGETNPRDGLTVLFDGMDGKYVAVGHVIAKTESFGGFTGAIEVPGELPTSPIRTALFNLMQDLKAGDKHNPGWWVVSHYR